MASNVKECGSQRARFMRNAMQHHARLLNDHVILNEEVLGGLKMTAHNMFHNETLDMILRQDIAKLSKEPGQKRWEMMLEFSKTKPAYVYVMWETAMAVKPVHNTEKEKVMKLKANLKTYFEDIILEKYSIVAEKMRLRKTDQRQKISLAHAIMKVDLQNDTQNDLEVSLDDRKTLTASFSAELIKNLKEANLYEKDMETEDIAYLASYISSLLVIKNTEVGRLTDELDTSRQKTQQAQVLTDRLQEMNEELRQQTNNARAEAMNVSKTVKQAVAEEVKVLREDMVNQNADILQKLEMLMKLQQQQINYTPPSRGNWMSMVTRGSQSSGSISSMSVYPIQESVQPYGRPSEDLDDPSAASS